MAIDRLNWDRNQGWLGPTPTKTIYQYMIVGDRVEETREITVHEFTMGDVEDPDLYAAQPLYEWQSSKFGEWVMAHASDTPTWYRMPDTNTYGYRYEIRAKFSGSALTEMLLRKNT